MRSLMIAAFTIVLATPAVQTAAAQTATQTAEQTAQQADTAKAVADTAPERFFTTKDAYVAAGMTGIAIIATRFDRDAADWLRTDETQSRKYIRKGAQFFKFMGQPAPQIIGGTLYITGKIFKSRKIAELGLHGTEAILMANAITNTTKMIAGRARPFVHDDSASADFKLFRGFKGRDFQSFPSGHATTAFAAAAASTAESQNIWPGHQLLVGAVMFSGATLVGVSRMYDDQHWASDVAVAAMVGTFSGFKVVKFNHEHPNNRVDRALLGLEIAPAPNGGVYVGQTIRFGATLPGR
jgi:membrane-associated phospholipid phosphatase